MKERTRNQLKNSLYTLAGLGGISLVIIVHEMGHFLFANFFCVPTPIFSLGFGPAFFDLPIGETTFQLALLPFGGYVEMDPAALAAQPYIPKMLILFGGIIFNFIFAYCIIFYYKIFSKHKKTTMKSTMTSMKQLLSHTQPEEENNTPVVMGPIGIIAIMGKSLAINSQLFWHIVALISLNVGVFNVLPLPFFDGGKALIATIEMLSGRTISPTILWYITMIFIALFMVCVAKITFSDVKRLNQKK